MDEDIAAAYGFSQVVRAGDLLFCAGQVGLEKGGSVPLDPQRQYDLAFAALGDVLKAQGRSPADIVDLTTFHVNYPDHMDVFLKAKTDFLGSATPAWTAIGVAALGYPTTLVEIKAIASAV